MMRRTPSATLFPYTTLFRSGIAIVAIEHYAAINRNDVAFLQRPLFRRDAVHNLFVHRRAQYTGIIVVSLERRLGSEFRDLLLGRTLQIHRGNARRYYGTHLIENLTHDAATVPHPLNLRRRLADNRHS